MPDFYANSPVLEHLGKGGKKLCLLVGTGQIRTVGSGKVAEKTFDFNTRQLCNLRANICRLRIGLKADAAHTGVYRQMERCGNAL